METVCDDVSSSWKFHSTRNLRKNPQTGNEYAPNETNSIRT